MKNEDIIKIVIEYITEERYRQAILIDGEWGAGKTFFVKEQLLDRLKQCLNDTTIYYVSLYGVSSSQQIMDEIYSARQNQLLQEKFGDKNGDKIGKGIYFTSKLLSAGMKYFNIEKEDLPKLSEIIELKKMVIVFDDLERCEMEINQTLGVINSLTEHNDIKTIIIANQNEIGKMNFFKNVSSKYQVALDTRIQLEEKNKNENGTLSKEELIKKTEQLFSEDFLFKKIKEKLIGLTIYYQPNLSEVFVSILNNYVKNEKSKDYLLANKQKIVNIFEDNKHYNIRTLIFSVIAFDKFVKIIAGIEFAERKYIDDELNRVLTYTVISSIKIKSGKPIYIWEKGSAKSGIVHYDKKNFYNRVYGYKFVDDYLLKCILDKNEIEKTIIDVISEQKQYNDARRKEESLSFRKLHTWWELEDDEIDEILNKVLEELREQKYGPGYFKDIIVTLMQMNYEKIKNVTYKDFISLMAEKLKLYEGDFEREHLEVLSGDVNFVKKYNEIAEPLFKVIDNKKSVDSQVENSFLCDRTFWDDNFKNKCGKLKDTYIINNKFFHYITPERFIGQLQEAKTAEIYRFMDGIKVVYSFSNLNEFFKPDIPNIEDIIEKLDIKQICNKKKTKEMALKKLKETLQEYLKLIKQPEVKFN